MVCFKILKGNFGLGREDCQQAVTDEFLCMVAGCVLGTDVCHWMFNTYTARPVCWLEWIS